MLFRRAKRDWIWSALRHRAPAITCHRCEHWSSGFSPSSTTPVACTKIQPSVSLLALMTLAVNDTSALLTPRTRAEAAVLCLHVLHLAHSTQPAVPVARFDFLDRMLLPGLLSRAIHMKSFKTLSQSSDTQNRLRKGTRCAFLVCESTWSSVVILFYLTGKEDNTTASARPV